MVSRGPSSAAMYSPKVRTVKRGRRFTRHLMLESRMHHFLFSARLPDGRNVCIARISSDAFEASNAHTLGDDTGYFIYELDERQQEAGIEVLAKAASYDAAVRLIDIFFSVQQATAHGASPPETPSR